MNSSNNIELLSAALALIQAEIKPAPKNDANPYFKSKFANLEAVWESARPVLAKHGVSIIQGGGFNGTQPVLKTRLLHKSGQWIESEFPLVCVEPNNPQALGSAITYLKRYGVKAALGMVDEDDDGNGATQMGKAGALQSRLSPGFKPPAPRSGPIAKDYDPGFDKEFGPA